ncbi:MAG TPA: hypothetical protein VGR77_06055 [Candidatus Dormibacteraeota bacterium]|nr:hypothetical protein [Candidatus Dormibacteraeota bacterium]
MAKRAGWAWPELDPAAEIAAEIVGRPPTVRSAIGNWIVWIVLVSSVSLLLQGFFLVVLGQANLDEAFGKGELLPVAAAILAAALSKRLTRRWEDSDMPFLGLLIIGLFLTSAGITVLWLAVLKKLQLNSTAVEVVSFVIVILALFAGVMTEIGYALGFRSRVRVEP